MLLCLYEIVKEYLNGNKKWYYYVIPLVLVTIIWVYTLDGISTEIILPDEDPTGSFGEVGGILVICEFIGLMLWCRVIYGTFKK